MLRGQLLHPEILNVLGRNGHGSRILIADGNFPFATKTHPRATLVSLNLSPGIVGATDVLRALCTAVPIESALVMQPPSAGPFAVQRPDVWDDYESLIRERNPDVSLDRVGRFNFYECCLSPDVCLVIATGEQRIFANLLLTLGVVRPDV